MGQASPTLVSSRAASFAVVAAALITFASVAWVLAPLPNLFDVDSYFHLAVARKYAQEGLGNGLPWARFSVMAEHFGDKELLFHVLLIPFARMDGDTGGKLAIALLNAAIAALLARQAVRAVGPWGLLLPVWLLFSAGDYVSRLLRLRPELLSLIELLLAVELATTRRYRTLGLLAVVFPLSHTAFQLLPALGVAWFVADGLRVRRWDWALPAYVVLGTVVGLFIHPHFPQNVVVWYVQNVLHARLRLPDAGFEFAHNTLSSALLMNRGWWVSLAALWLARRKEGPAAEEPESTRARYLLLAALVFGVLYAYLSRFATYFVPFATLALLHHLRARGERPAAWVRLPGRWRLPSLAFALAAALLSLQTVTMMRSLFRLSHAYDAGRHAEGRALSAALPPGAAVAATWLETEMYVYYAPQARYLNVLDPVFMAARDPVRYALTLAVFDGREPDLPYAVKVNLASDYVALSQEEAHGANARLLRDPRILTRHRGHLGLFELQTRANEAFALDWQLAPGPVDPSRVTADEVRRWPPYPRPEQAGQREYEGFVDFRRLDRPERCQVFGRVVDVPEGVEQAVEFAPYGSGSLWVDGERTASIDVPRRAVLGQGERVRLSLARGPHTMTVTTCAADGYGGFYLVGREGAL
jgi:hypothetical protein